MTDPSTALADTSTPPPFDPEVEAVLDMMRAVAQPLSDEGLAETRRTADEGPRPDLTAGGAVTVTERTIPGPEGAPDLNVTILSPASGATGLPGIYYIHGGGLVMGNRYMNLDELVPFVAQSQAVVVSVSYRFAPEHKAPAQLDDAYAGLAWTANNAKELGIDPERLMVLGISAGGGLALGISLLARDRGFPKLTHQILLAPMIDDRLALPSHRMHNGIPSDYNDYLYCWEAALGDERGGPNVSPYVAPARAQDLSGLPRTFIDCGGSETCRDEIITMAMRLSQAGVSVDAHMWAGGIHGFYFLAPHAAISQAARATLVEFITRALGD